MASNDLPIQDWETVYRTTKPEDLPWNAGGADPSLTTLIQSGRIPKGPALDIGTGPGHDAAYLAHQGFRVLAVDVSPTAIALAKDTAREAGVASRIEFRVANILTLEVPDSTLAFVNDRGCFHVLTPEERPTYVQRVHAMLKSDGYLFLRTFSIEEPPGPGPHRFSRREIEDSFTEHFTIREMNEGFFEGSRRPRALLILLQKNESS